MVGNCLFEIHIFIQIGELTQQNWRISHYWEFIYHLYNHQCYPISFLIITWEKLVLNLLYLQSGLFFTTFDPVPAIALKIASAAERKQDTNGLHGSRLWAMCLEQSYIWIWKQLKVNSSIPLEKGAALLHLNKLESSEPKVVGR